MHSLLLLGLIDITIGSESIQHGCVEVCEDVELRHASEYVDDTRSTCEEALFSHEEPQTSSMAIAESVWCIVGR